MSEVWLNTRRALSEDRTYRKMFWLMDQYRDHVAAEITDADEQIITRNYDTYIRMSQAACGNLQRLEMPVKGQIIGLIYETCMDWPVLFWGLLMAGATPLLMNPAAEPGNLEAIMKEAHADSYVAAAPVEGSERTFVDAAQILADGAPGVEEWSDTVALCTSGTTGSSRLFLYDGKAITAQLISFDEAKQHNPEMPFNEDTPCKLLAFLPFHHVFGFSVIYILYSCTGKTLVYLRDRSTTTILNTCRRHGVTNLYCIPMFFNALAQGLKHRMAGTKTPEEMEKMIAGSLRMQAEAARFGKGTEVLPDAIKKIQASLLGSSIRVMISGGGHIMPETLQILNAIGYPLYNGFGMTESGIVSVEQSLNPLQRVKGSIGFPFGVTEYRILPEGAISGELQIRGEALHTATIIDGQIVRRDPEEWFSTGDLVRKAKDGLYIIGRCKEVIVNASGENIYPDELEERFLMLPQVAKSCIVGIRDGVYEDVTLVAEAMPGAEVDATALAEAVKAVNAKLQPYEKVRRVLISDVPLPLSGSLKVKRQYLKRQIEEGFWKYTECFLSKRRQMQAAAIVTAPYEKDDRYIAIKREVKTAFAEALRLDVLEIGDRDHFVMDLGGDSLAIAGAISTLEKKYKLIVLDSEMHALANVFDTASMIFSRLYGEKVEVTGETRVARKDERITDFRNSEEYYYLQRRMEDTFPDPSINPYFLPHDSLIRDTSVIHGKEVINLGSYNYLGMSGHPETVKAAQEAAARYGTSASGSRTLAGEKTLYMDLEKAIASWKHTEDAIVCTGGWATNMSFISTFMGEGDFILYDALSHNSITTGVALSRAESKAFAHNNLEQLEQALIAIQGQYNKVLIVVEGVYSMDGDLAPIPEFVRLKKQYHCFLMVDEAHSGGVLGDHAGGVDDYWHLEPKDIDIKMGTMSKALGTCGGFIAADHSIVEYLRYSMNGFVFTAGIAPPLAAACMKAIELIQTDNSAAEALHRNIEYFVRRAKEEGMDTCLAKESAIVPILIGSDADAARLSSMLLNEGVFIPPAMYPAVPKGESRLRVTISATHSLEQLETAIQALSRLLKQEGFIK